MPNPGDGASAQFDVSELVATAELIQGAGTRLRREIPRVMKRGAQNIKTDAQRRYRRQAGSHGRGHAWRYPSTIGYDVATSGWQTVAEIGPDKTKPQGALGNLLEYGSANNAPLPHLNPAFNAEIPKTEVALAAAARRAVLG